MLISNTGRQFVANLHTQTRPDYTAYLSAKYCNSDENVQIKSNLTHNQP